MPKAKKPITAGQVIFEIFFILSYPFLAVFSATVTFLVWFFSLLSRMASFLFARFK